MEKLILISFAETDINWGNRRKKDLANPSAKNQVDGLIRLLTIT
jgi:hypothetical protein